MGPLNTLLCVSGDNSLWVSLASLSPGHTACLRSSLSFHSCFHSEQPRKTKTVSPLQHRTGRPAPLPGAPLPETKHAVCTRCVARPSSRCSVGAGAQVQPPLLLLIINCCLQEACLLPGPRKPRRPPCRLQTGRLTPFRAPQLASRATGPARTASAA